MTIAELFETRKADLRWNTSYPLSPDDWKEYRVHGRLPFSNDMSLSFYIHIPFCRQLCSFCEYTRMLCPAENTQELYLRTVALDIQRFKEEHKGRKLLGFDIGGGTPTSLSEANFYCLMEVYREAIAGMPLSDDYEPSIEATFNTLSSSKLHAMASNGFQRLSLGVQSSCKSLLHSHSRVNCDEQNMAEWLNVAHEAGIKKVNLDFMYGLKGQDESTIIHDLELIERLHPQQVTLYELRTNMLAGQESFSKNELYCQYTQYYSGLIKMGYNAHFGQNTFSVNRHDEGTSSYLRKRMLNGAPYKGFGLAAQSMSSHGVSYNIGKLSCNPHQVLNATGYPEEYTYMLPPHELASKYLAVSAYNGSFSTKRLKDFGADNEQLSLILDFCFSNGLLRKGKNERVYITPKGFMHYGALFSLFINPKP